MAYRREVVDHRRIIATHYNQCHCQSEVVIKNSLGMRFVKVPAAEFIVDSWGIEGARMEIPGPKPGDVEDEWPTHKLVISRPFFLGETEATRGFGIE